MRPFASHDETADRPLLFLVYTAIIAHAPDSAMNGDVEIGLFTKEELKSVPLQPHTEKFRDTLIEMLFGS